MGSGTSAGVCVPETVSAPKWLRRMDPTRVDVPAEKTGPQAEPSGEGGGWQSTAQAPDGHLEGAAAAPTKQHVLLETAEGRARPTGSCTARTPCPEVPSHLWSRRLSTTPGCQQEHEVSENGACTEPRRCATSADAWSRSHIKQVSQTSKANLDLLRAATTAKATAREDTLLPARKRCRVDFGASVPRSSKRCGPSQYTAVQSSAPCTATQSTRTCSDSPSKGESVETALARLPEAQRRRGEKALLYLLSSEDSSYAKFWRLHHRFLHTRRRQVERGDIDAATPIKRLPVSFLETVGLECALWPQLYWRDGDDGIVCAGIGCTSLPKATRPSGLGANRRGCRRPRDRPGDRAPRQAS